MRRAMSSKDPFRKKTSRPRTRAGTRSSARTSRGHTSEESRPKTAAPTPAVTAIRVALSPLLDSSWKSGSTPARTSMVTVDTAHTAMLRHTPLRSRRQRPPPTPCPPHVPARPVCEACSHPVTTVERPPVSPSAAVVARGRHRQAAVDPGLHLGVVRRFRAPDRLDPYAAAGALGGELVDGGEGALQDAVARRDEQVHEARLDVRPQGAVVGAQTADEELAGDDVTALGGPAGAHRVLAAGVHEEGVRVELLQG